MEIPTGTGKPDFTNLKKALSGMPVDSDKFDLVDHLASNGVVDRTATKLANWPPEIQKYISKELRSYARGRETYPESDLGVINQFLQTALQGGSTEAANYSDEDWAKALNSLAHELRRYYGLQENDEELPCWRRG